MALARARPSASAAIRAVGRPVDRGRSDVACRPLPQTREATLRIALVTETFHPKIDGIVTRLRATIPPLLEAGHELCVFTPHRGITEYEGVPVVTCPGVSLPSYPEVKLSVAGPRTLAALRRFDPDIVHVVAPFSLGLGPIFWAYLAGRPLAVSFHIDLAKSLSLVGAGRHAERLWRTLTPIYNLADVVLCTSPTTRDSLAGRGVERLHVWRWGIDTRRFHPGRRSDAMRARLTGGEPDRRLLLFVGRLSAEKSIEQLHHVVTARPELRLAIVGDGPQRPGLEALFAGTGTVFTGYLEGDALAEAYASADLFVLPSRSETLGIVVLEALAAGCPAVVVEGEGVVDLVQDGVQGMRAPRPTPESLLDAVDRALAPEVLARLAAAARPSVEGRAWAAATEDYVAALERAVARPRTASAARRLAVSARQVAVIGISWSIAAAYLLGRRLGLGTAADLARVTPVSP